MPAHNKHNLDIKVVTLNLCLGLQPKKNLVKETILSQNTGNVNEKAAQGRVVMEGRQSTYSQQVGGTAQLDSQPEVLKKLSNVPRILRTTQ